MRGGAILIALCAGVVFFPRPKFENNSSLFLILENTSVGLGNQMFLYAAGLAYAKRMNRPACLLQENNQLQSQFKLSIDLCKNISEIDEIMPKPIKVCAMERFSEKIFVDPTCSLFQGYLQNEAFFKDFKKEILNEFQFLHPLSTEKMSLAKQMRQENSVCLHIRRGDYLEEGYPILGQEYYDKALAYIREHDPEPIRIYVFSNDMPWVKKNFKTKMKTIYMEGNSDITDMHLMTHCRHNVIANSSFSWWGAYLNPNSHKIVIAPDIWDYWHPWWVEEIVPKEWVMLSAHASPEKNN